MYTDMSVINTKSCEQIGMKFGVYLHCDLKKESTFDDALDLNPKSELESIFKRGHNTDI